MWIKGEACVFQETSLSPLFLPITFAFGVPVVTAYQSYLRLSTLADYA